MQPAQFWIEAIRHDPVNVDRIQSQSAARPPAAIMLYTLVPDLLLGWPRANRPEER
jgi:hypothetical protein